VFGKLILLWAVKMYSWEASSEAMAGMFDNVVVGLLVHNSWWFWTLLFSGLLVPEEDVCISVAPPLPPKSVSFLTTTISHMLQLFWPLKIFYYFTPLSYYVRSAVRLVFVYEDWSPCDDPLSFAVCVSETSGLDVLAATKHIFPVLETEDTYWRDILVLLGLCLCWKMVAIAIISYKAQREVDIGDPAKAPPHGLAAVTSVAEHDSSTTKRGAVAVASIQPVRTNDADSFLSDEDASEMDI
jgi:hypothetical protein